MKRLLIAATLALGALVGSEMQARADGKFGIGIGLNLTFSYSCTNPGACPLNYGCGTPIPYPPMTPTCQTCQGSGYPMPGYGGFDPSMSGMLPQGYGVPQYVGGYNNFGGMSGMASGQAAPTNAGSGNYPMFAGNQGVYAVAE